MLAHAYKIILIVVLDHKHTEDMLLMVLMLLKKRLLSMLMTTVKLTVSTAYKSHMAMHASTENTYISLAREFQNIVQTQHGHLACCIMKITENVPVN